MQRTFPWRNAEELATILRFERDSLDQQIAALEQSGDINDQTGRLQVLLCKYLIEGNAKQVTDWATSAGWRVDSTNRGKPSTRNWQPKDLYEAIQTEQTGLTAGLADLCSRVYYVAPQLRRSIYRD